MVVDIVADVPWNKRRTYGETERPGPEMSAIDVLIPIHSKVVSNSLRNLIKLLPASIQPDENHISFLQPNKRNLFAPSNQPAKSKRSRTPNIANQW